MSVKYYRLAKGEEPPEEFCAVRDVNGEPSEYTWYERMSEFDRDLWVLFTKNDWFAGSEYRKLQSENAKLRELVRDYINAPCTTCDCWQDDFRCWNYDGSDCGLVARARELGIEVDG